MEALQTESNSHCLKEDSILNKIRYFHCARLGMMMPCVHHDIFAGCAREDICLVINEMYKRKVITKNILERKCALFKKMLKGTDKLSWMPALRQDSFKTKLPGTMTQNQRFIQFFSLLVYS